MHWNAYWVWRDNLWTTTHSCRLVKTRVHFNRVYAIVITIQRTQHFNFKDVVKSIAKFGNCVPPSRRSKISNHLFLKNKHPIIRKCKAFFGRDALFSCRAKFGYFYPKRRWPITNEHRQCLFLVIHQSAAYQF